MCAQRQPPRPESSQLRQESRLDAGGGSGDAAQQSAGQRRDVSGGTTASGAESVPTHSPGRADPAGCSRAEPWPRAAQHSGPCCEPLYSPILSRRADAARQREADTDAGSAPFPLPDAAADLNVTEPLRSFDPEAAVPQPQLQTAGRDAVPEQHLGRGLPAGVHPSREHLFRRESSLPGIQPQQHRRAASSASALHAAQAAARKALASGVKAAPEVCPCTRCGGPGHSHETCRFSDRTARKRRKKAKLAAKAARDAAKATAASTACAATTADGVPPVAQQPGVKRKRKPKGVSEFLQAVLAAYDGHRH